MHRIMEPDGPLTEEQLEAVARTFYYEQRMRAGHLAEQIDGEWESAPDSARARYRELMRGPVCSANAYWGRHVRRHQAELLRRETGDHVNTRNALAIIIAWANGDAVEAARTLMEILELPE